MPSLLDNLHCRQWFYPGPLRVFTPEEIAKAGMQPWPVAVDSYVALNLVTMLPALLFTREGTGWATALMWWIFWCALAALTLLASRSLWRHPTRRRLNVYCYGTALAVLVVALGLIRHGERDWVKRENVTFIIAMTGVLSAWWMLTVFRVQQIEARLREIEDQAATLRLSTRLAAAQIQPHFLFNTLASLQHWVDTGDARAAPLLRDFTAYLRATLPMFERELQPLADEMEMVRRYLAIMQARLGARLSFKIEVQAEVEAFMLPPGIVLTLVENAIAHGIEPRLDGGHIDVKADRSENRVKISVYDDGGGPAAGWTEGVGLSNTRRRLLNAFPDAWLELLETHPGCFAMISIPAL
ncbi:MAG: histidine kinase [Burkholderiales bacterium]|jgi:hypothetical protein|nr:histidine kinase [Burkholderiales bacterium]